MQSREDIKAKSVTLAVYLIDEGPKLVHAGRPLPNLGANPVKKQSIADATILCLGAILEALPPKTQVSAARLARKSLEAGLASDEQSERIVRGVFLLDENMA